jgi:hypothetical protein
MAAGKHNILIEQGATFSKTLTLKDEHDAPINLTGKTFASKLRRRHTDTAASATFTFTVINAALGTVRWSLTATQTAGILAEPHYYDLEMTDGATVTRLMEGTAFVNFEVTK